MIGFCGMRPATFDRALEALKIVLLLSSFAVLTNFIFADTENIKDFVTTVVVAVFVLMVFISYLMLSIVTEGSRNKSTLVFQDQESLKWCHVLTRLGVPSWVRVLSTRIWGVSPAGGPLL